MGVGAGHEDAVSEAVADGSGDAQWRGGFNNRAQPEASPDADWTANDDWLDALGLGVGPSLDEAAPADAAHGSEDARPASSAEGSAVFGTSAGDLSKQPAGGSASGAAQGTAADSNRGEEGGGGEDGWFFDGSRAAAAAVTADPAAARQSDERRSDRRKAAVGGSGEFASQRARDADNRGGWGADGRSGGGRRDADGVDGDTQHCKLRAWLMGPHNLSNDSQCSLLRIQRSLHALALADMCPLSHESTFQQWSARYSACDP